VEVTSDERRLVGQDHEGGKGENTRRVAREPMSWITVIFSMTASAYLTTASIYAFIWWRQRDAWAHLLFSVAALAAAAFVWCDLAEMHAELPAQFGSAIRWAQLSLWVMVLALAGFVRLYLRAGRIWLLGSVCVLRTLSLCLNFLTGGNLNYGEITRLRSISFLGESVAIAKGVPNPWMFLGQLSLLGLLIFVADAAYTVWRRGDRRQALLVGGSIVFFVLAGSGQAVLIFWGHAGWPLTPSLFYVGIVAAMGYELGGDALRAVQLSHDLRARDQQIILAAEAANMGFWYRESGQTEFWACDQWRALVGFTRSEPLHLDNFLQRLHPNDREITRQTLANASQGDGRYHMEHRVLLPDGQMRWLACQGRVELNDKNQPGRLQGVSLDITRRKQAELDAQAHRNEVAHLLRVTSLGELSSALAHELKQPLSAILNNAQAAQLFLANEPCDLEEIRAILGDIVMDDERASEVIDRLHTLLKKGEFQPQALEANDLIRDVLKLMNHDLEARAVRIVTEFGGGLPSIRGDRVQLQQVLINLILNAGDAMAQAAGSARTLTVRSIPMADDAVEISVADTGIGIPPGREEKIFQPYHSSKPQGLGLGLWLSRSIVFAHGGRMWAENRAAGGATFHFTIPLWKDDSRRVDFT
jgi:two-component system sensor kinase FixL